MAMPVKFQDKLLGSLKSKTAWLGVGVVILGALQTQVDWVSLVGTQNAGVILSAIGGAIYVLRWITKTPIDQK